MTMDVEVAKDAEPKTSPYFKKAAPKPTAVNTATKRKRTTASKLSPFVEDIINIKLKHPDQLIFVEFGYSYRVYCEDAMVVHKIMNYKVVEGRASFYEESKLNTKKSSSLSYCMINASTIDKCLAIIVAHNHKVLLYKQSKNPDDTNERYIDKSMSLSTFDYITDYVPDIEVDVSNKILTVEYNTILCVYFSYVNEPLKSIHLLGLKLKTHEVAHETIIAEEYSDTSRLQTQFVEILAKFDSIEVVTNHEAPESLISVIYGYNKKTKVYRRELKNSNSEEHPMEYLLLNEYLQDYNLDHVLRLNYDQRKTLFKEDTCSLSTNIIRHLNFFTNHITANPTSTFWGLVNNRHIATSYGKDMLIEWIKSPLTNIAEIEMRNETITYFGVNTNLPLLLNGLTSFFNHARYKNFHKTAMRINLSKNRTINRKDVYLYLTALNEFKTLFKAHADYVRDIKMPRDSNRNSKNTPTLLKRLLIKFERILKEIKIDELLKHINQAAAFSKDLEESVINFFNLAVYDHAEEMNKKEKEISLIMEKKNQLLETYKLQTGKPYLHFENNGFNISLPTKDARNMPKEWKFIKRYIGLDKLMSAYHVPELLPLIEEYEIKHYERLQICNAEYFPFLERINVDYDKVKELVDILATIDCLRCLGFSTKLFPAKPTFITQPGHIILKKAYHPMLEYSKNMLTSPNSSQNIPNNISLSSNKLFILTGPNAGGKTTILKKVMYLCILAQLGCNTPCSYHKQSVFTSFDIRTGSSDSVLSKKSTFLNEMLEYQYMSENAMSERSLVVLDEIGRGTSHIDGASLTYAFLKDLKERGKRRGVVMFVTHYHDILKNDFNESEIYKMGFYTVVEGDHKVSVPNFKLERGIGKSLGVELAKICGFDDDIVEDIEDFKEKGENRKLKMDFAKFVRTGDINTLKSLLDDI